MAAVVILLAPALRESVIDYAGNDTGKALSLRA